MADPVYFEVVGDEPLSGSAISALAAILLEAAEAEGSTAQLLDEGTTGNDRKDDKWNGPGR